MRNSLKLGFVLALGATAVFAGCSSGSDNTDGGAGTSAGGSTTGHAGTGAAGTSIVVGGSSNGGSATAGSGNGGSGTAGSGTAGSSSAGAAGHAGNAAAGSGGTAGAGAGGSSGTAGAAGKGGAGGSGGATGSAGAGGKGGSGGTTGSAGAAGSGGSGGSSGGSGGTSSCAEETTGISAAGGVGGATSNSIYLIDDVVVANSVPANAQGWHFPAAAPLITDTTTGTGGVWIRSPYTSFGTDVGPHNTFLACDSATVDAASGSVKNLVPFSAVGQYYELLMTFASTDYSNAVISAKVKLVNDGVAANHCAQAQIHLVGADPYPQAEGAWTTLTKDTWKSVTFTAAATGVTTTQQLGVRIKLNGTCL